MARINETNDHFERSHRLSHASLVSTDFGHQYGTNALPDVLERQIYPNRGRVVHSSLAESSEGAPLFRRGQEV